MIQTTRRKVRDVRKEVERQMRRRRYRDRLTQDLPWVFGNSFPKSGTNLLRQVMDGLTRIGPFIDLSDQIIVTFDGSTGRKRRQAEILADLDKTRPGDIVSGHLHATPENVERLCRPGVVHYFIFRDPRDVVVSHAFYITRMAPQNVHHDYYTHELDSLAERLRTSILGRPEIEIEFPDIRGRFELYLPWLEQESVLAVKFEDLIEDRRPTLERIWNHFCASGYSMGVSDEQALEAMEISINPSRSPTFRKGKTGEWRKHFEEQHISLFKEVAGDLLIQLGYETDLDW